MKSIIDLLIIHTLLFMACTLRVAITLWWSSLQVSNVEGHFMSDMEGRKKRVVLVLDIVCFLFSSIYGLVRNIVTININMSWSFMFDSLWTSMDFITLSNNLI